MNIDKLKKTAKAATKGNWTAFIKGTTVAVLNNDDGRSAIIEWNGFDSSYTSVTQQKANARFIAAVQPGVVLELLEKIEDAKREGYNAAINDAAELVDTFNADGETIKQQFLSA